ncbi:MAG: hypothetical protein ACJAS1_005230 [Oleiphilaceae bacterium]|jgi:hypothetical protein
MMMEMAKTGNFSTFTEFQQAMASIKTNQKIVVHMLDLCFKALIG